MYVINYYKHSQKISNGSMHLQQLVSVDLGSLIDTQGSDPGWGRTFLHKTATFGGSSRRIVLGANLSEGLAYKGVGGT